MCRLWEDGWKDRYYETKFDVSCEDTDFVSQVVESYTEGLCWVMAYYYQVSVLGEHCTLTCDHYYM